MGATPSIKVYDANGQYVAACRDAGDAAAIVLRHGYGARVKVNGRIVYRAEHGDEVAVVAETIQRTAARHRGERFLKYCKENAS